MTTKKELAIALSRLDDFANPKAKFEQYITDSNIAADILWQAHMRGDIAHKTIADLGAGTGVLGIGALLLGAKHVHFVEIDEDALKMCKKNVDSLSLSDVNHVSYHLGPIDHFSQRVDVVIQNPPFGTKQEHADRNFLMKAFSLADIVYTFHKTSTEGFVETIARDEGFVIRERAQYDFPLPHTYAFHEKTRGNTKVTIFALQKNSPAYSKQEMRKLMLDRRQALPLIDVRQHSEQIIQRLLQQPEYEQAHVVLAYVSKGNEVYTHTFLQNMFGDKRVVVPKTVGDSLELYEIASLNDLAVGKFQILEPITSRRVEPEHIDLAIVPVVAFDPSCNRMGYGKGYYDRLLRKLHCPTIGIAFEEQKVHTVPTEPHDLKLHKIITEKDVYP